MVSEFKHITKYSPEALTKAIAESSKEDWGCISVTVSSDVTPGMAGHVGTSYTAWLERWLGFSYEEPMSSHEEPRE
jgi:hypothetical protein